MYTKLKTHLKKVTLITATITLFIGITLMKNDFSAANIAFIVWAISPYLFLVFLINLAANKITTLTSAVITIATCVTGLVTFIYSLLSQLDNQGGLIFIDTPLWQWAGLIIISLPLVLLNKIHD